MAEGPDWGDGDYARTARVLAPASDALLDAVGVAPGQRVLDVACGTGNAALAAARRGARGVGVDPSAALVAAAADATLRDALPADFVVGGALALPVADGAFDVVLSVFGIIFAPDAGRAVAELVRAARPGGRVGCTSWVPSGPISAAGRVLMAAVSSAETAGSGPAPPPFDPPRWGDPAFVRGLLAEHGVHDVRVDEAGLPFTAASPEAWFSEQEAHHPVWRWGRRRLSPARWDALRAESVAALAAGNEDPAAFRTTSRYLIVTGSVA